MQDRIVQYPNRFRLTPVDGVENTYDVTPVPGAVIQEGTPLNKANLLTDATATLLELAGNPSVNDALGKLTDRARVVTGSYVGTGTSGADNPNVLNVGFVPKVVVIRADGELYEGYGYMHNHSITELVLVSSCLEYATNHSSFYYTTNAGTGYGSGYIKLIASFGDTVSYYADDGRYLFNGAGKLEETTNEQWSASAESMAIGQLNQVGRTYYYAAIG